MIIDDHGYEMDRRGVGPRTNGGAGERVTRGVTGCLLPHLVAAEFV